MNPTGGPPRVAGGASAGRSPLADRPLLRHGLFALAYLVVAVATVKFVNPGTAVSLVWPSAGVAVWWALTCRSRRSFLLVCAFVFAVPTSYMLLVNGRSIETVWLLGVAYVLSGPAIRPVMEALERVREREEWLPAVRGREKLARIAVPGDVYRLLIASLITLPLAKCVSMVWFALDGDAVSMSLYMSLVLRDLAGVMVVAGPGLAIASWGRRDVDATALRHTAIALAATSVLLALIFGPGQELPIAYLASLPLFWSATRLPVSSAAVHAVFTTVTAAILAYWIGAGPFAAPETPVQQALAIQIFIILTVLLTLVVSTTVQQRSSINAELSALTMTIPDAVVTVDREGRAMPVNSAGYDVVVANPGGGYASRPIREVYDVGLPGTLSPIAQALGGGSVRAMIVELADPAPGAPSSDRRTYSVSASPLYGPGGAEPDQALLLYHDLTEGHRLVRELQRARDEAQDLFDDAPQGVATLGTDGRILQANRAFGDLVGVPEDRLPGRRLDEFCVDGDLDEEIGLALGEPGTLVRADRSLGAADGRSVMVALSLRTMTRGDESSPQLLVNAVDVTERQELHDLVSHLADHDATTGLINRRRFDREFESILERSASESGAGALLLIDLDDFKSVNDLLGHHVGDELLVEFAQLLTASVRSTDVVARLGGDEFAIVLPSADKSIAIAVAGGIVDAVRRRFRDRPDALGRVTASIGVALFADARYRATDVLLRADQLLYDAKRSGRDCFVAPGSGEGSTGPVPPVVPRDRVERILRSDALTLELQPIVELATGRVVLAEGLVRDAGSAQEMSTGEFVAAVERAGLGPELDSRVLRRGIRLLPQLQRARPGFRLSLNISAQSLGSDEVARVIVSELEVHRVPFGSLVLEVTETAPITDIESARSFRRTMREHGVSLALDDFGAGCEPYRYLRQLEVDIVKIAGEFVENMADGDIDSGIVRSIVDLAEGQGMRTVAEFVSDERILSAARLAGITYAQGSHIGMSLPLDEFLSTHLVDSAVGVDMEDR